jgi:hypothetical protein
MRGFYNNTLRPFVPAFVALKGGFACHQFALGLGIAF